MLLQETIEELRGGGIAEHTTQKILKFSSREAKAKQVNIYGPRCDQRNNSPPSHVRVCYRTVQPHRFICIGLRCIDSHRRREQVCLFSSVFHSVRVFRPITINCFQECWVHRRAQCLLPSSMREGPRRNARICKARNLINSRAFPWAPAHLHGKNT